MKYLNRKGDLAETAKTPSILVFNNWSEDVPKFCFIVPTYKRADLLKYAIESILSQSQAPTFEILVVDDNPDRNDETEDLMKGAFNIPGIAYYKNSRNLRQEGNWNKLFELARTEWMIMLHDDDMFYPDYFIYLQKCMNLYDDSIGAYFPMFVGHTFNDGVLPERKENKIRARLIKEFDFLQGCVLGAPVGMCVRRDLTLTLGGVNIHSGVAVDYDFFNRLCKATDVVKMYEYPLAVWRILENVSQKVETVLYCVEWGTVLKNETLEDLDLKWLSPIYEYYIRGFNRQHIESWYMQMNKGRVDKSLMYKASKCDMLVYKILRIFLAIVRRLRMKNVKIEIC